MFGQTAIDRFLKSLDGIEFGSLELVTPDGQTRFFGGRHPGVTARMHIYNWAVAHNLATKGDTGFAMDYQRGHWDTNNLQNLLSLGLLNDGAIRRYIFGSRMYQFISHMSYLFRLNTLKGSRRNIHAHYDLGNEFYKLWLDDTMTYSSALFLHHGERLEDAQNNKYDRIIDRLSGTSGDLLEIGCGWGGFAARSLQKTDFNVKGITLSTEQQAFASQRVDGQAVIALEDYRHQAGKFDHIVSIEMFEAVGEKYWPTYFEKIASMLKNGGKAVVQTITIADEHFKTYRRGNDFIRSAIFPGGMLPSPTRFAQETEKAGLKMTDRFDFGQDYAETLERWMVNFDSKKSEIKTLGFDDGFIRLWRFYLAACIAGFKTGRTDVMQVELQNI